MSVDQQVVASYERHSKYYCEEVVILVESTLFRVPRVIFQQSQVFQDMFSVPQGGDTIVEGSDDAHPLYLPSYLAKDFEQLLRVLFRQEFPLKMACDEWISVLKLATVWDFAAIRLMAIEELEEDVRKDPILKIILSRQYSVKDWMLPALNTLAQRANAVNEADLERLLGLGDPISVSRLIVKMGQARESFTTPLVNKTSTGCYSHGSNYCHGHGQHGGTYCSKGYPATRAWYEGQRSTHDFTVEIQRIFKEELAAEALETSDFL